MKIAMIGSGAAGSVFAAYLRKGGAELWLVDKYKAHMDKIVADGLVFRTPEGEEVLTGFHTSATARDIGTMDMVILMVKGHADGGRHGRHHALHRTGDGGRVAAKRSWQ